MDRGAWRAPVYGVARVGHDLVSKPVNAQIYLKISFLQHLYFFGATINHENSM